MFCAHHDLQQMQYDALCWTCCWTVLYTPAVSVDYWLVVISISSDVLL